MRVAIVEDDPAIQTQLSSYVRRYFSGRENQVLLTVFDDGDELLDNYTANYDLILMDIQMRLLNGLEAAEKLRHLDENVYLIFVTNMANYAIRGYAVNALDFVLKPVSYLRLSALLERVEKLLSARDHQYLTFPTDNGLRRISVNEVSYIETDKHISTVHTDKGDFRLRESMKNMEEMLSKHHFFRCNNCYLVNMSRVEQVTRTDVTVAGVTLAISRPRYKPFMEALTRYLGGGGS